MNIKPWLPIPLMTILMTALFAGATYAQIALEDSRGKNSINLFSQKGGTLTFNSSNKQIKFNVVNYRLSRKTFFFYGLEVSGKARNNAATIFSSGEIAPGGALNAKLGIRLKTSNRLSPYFRKKVMKLQDQPNSQEKISALKTKYPVMAPAYNLWLLMKGGYSISSFKLFDPQAPFDEQVSRKYFHSYQFSLGLNYWNANFLHSNIILTMGASIGYRLNNNLSALEEKTIEDVNQYPDPDSLTTRVATSSQTAFQGPYDEFNSLPLYFDLYVASQKMRNIGLYYYSRTNFIKEVKDQTHMGVGLVLFKDYKPLETIGAIVVEIPDIFDVRDRNIPLGDKLKINLLISLPILQL